MIQITAGQFAAKYKDLCLTAANDARFMSSVQFTEVRISFCEMERSESQSGDDLTTQISLLIDFP
jgi:hypothetical protein